MISVIIINYNTFDLTKKCIQSIIHNTKNILYEIILVDNASSECDAEEFKRYFPEIVLLKSQKNLGFAKGNNFGIQYSSGEVILLLNSDTYFTEDVLEKSLSKFKILKNIGFMGVKMIYPNGKIQYTARKFRSIGWELLDLFRFIPMLLPYTVRARLMQGKYFKGDFSMYCDWLNGAFLLFNKSILNHLPNHQLDDRFFMYGEDQLWCLQLNEIGLRNYFYHGTSIVHINNASTAPAKRNKLLHIMYKNELEIMKIRFGQGVYYNFLFLIYSIKEQTRIALKTLFFMR